MADNLSRGLGFGQNRIGSAAFGSIPEVNQWLSGRFTLPIASSIGSFRLSYQNPLLTRPGIGPLTPGTATATYTTSHAKDSKIDFTAAAQVRDGGARGFMGEGGSSSPANPGAADSPNGAATGVAGNGNQKGPSASVSVRLSF
jgi:hypothetical protein